MKRTLKCHIKNTIEKAISLPKSIYVSFRLFPFLQALKIPILCRYNVKCVSLRGRVSIKQLDRNSIKMGMIEIGFGHVGVFDKQYSRSILEINGCIHFDGNGKYHFGHGCRICVGPKANLHIGTRFHNSAEMTLICMDEIHIGNQVLTSWNTLIMDTDFHETMDTQTLDIHPSHAPIFIGNKVWIGTRSIILKGTIVPNGSIVGANTVVNKKFHTENVLIAGNPATIKKTNITRYFRNYK